MNSLLDKKEGEFDKMKTTIALKLKEVEQQFIEANNEMRQQLEDVDQERGESEWKATLDQQRARISSLESENRKLKSLNNELDAKVKDITS